MAEIVGGGVNRLGHNGRMYIPVKEMAKKVGQLPLVGAGPCCGAGMDGREGDWRERLAGVVACRPGNGEGRGGREGGGLTEPTRRKEEDV